MLEAVTRASWLVHAITEPLCNQLVVEKYGCWGNSHGMQPYSIRNMRNLHQIYHCLWGKMLVPYSYVT